MYQNVAMGLLEYVELCLFPEIPLLLADGERQAGGTRPCDTQHAERQVQGVLD